MSGDGPAKVTTVSVTHLDDPRGIAPALRAMAEQEVSPNEAAVARAKLDALAHDPRGPRPPSPVPEHWVTCQARHRVDETMTKVSGKQWSDGQRFARCGRPFDPTPGPRGGAPKRWCSEWCKDADRRFREHKAPGDPSPSTTEAWADTPVGVIAAFALGAEVVHTQVRASDPLLASLGLREALTDEEAAAIKSDPEWQVAHLERATRARAILDRMKEDGDL